MPGMVARRLAKVIQSGSSLSLTDINRHRDITYHAVRDFNGLVVEKANAGMSYWK